MEQRKININRPELSKAAIEKHKSFDAVLRKQYPHLNLVKNKWFWGGSFLTTLLVAVVVIQIDENENVDPKQEQTVVISESPALVEDNSQLSMETVEANENVVLKGDDVLWMKKSDNTYSFKSKESFQLEKEMPFQIEVNGKLVQAEQESGEIDVQLDEKKAALKKMNVGSKIRIQTAEDVAFTIDVDPKEFPEFYKRKAIFAFSDKNPQEKLNFFNGIVWEDIELKKIQGELQLHISKANRKEFIIVEPIIPAREYALYEKEYMLLSTERDDLRKQVETLEAQKAVIPYAVKVEAGNGVIQF